MAITTQNGAYADPNTNMGREMIKNERGDTYLTKHYSDGTGESTFGLPEWIPDDTGKYQPYIIMENPNTYVIENKYLPMSINKADCMTTLYLNNENILDGADTLMEKQYWEVYHKENETDNYQLLDTSTWDCETTFTSGNDFSIFTTWTKSHGYETLEPSQYDVTSTNSTGTYYYRTLTETTTTPNVVTGQTTITNSTGTFTIDVIEDVTETTTTNIRVIPSEIKSEFQVEYRYMIDEGEVESFTRITNNDVNLENHYFQFVNKFDGVNFDAFNLGDDIEFTDNSYIGTYYATAENVPDKYIHVAEQGYPLYYSLEKGEEWWTGAGAEIYMDGAEKKLNVQVDFGKDRTPLPLDTMQELDPTLSLSATGERYYSNGTYGGCSASFYSGGYSQDGISTHTNGSCGVESYEYDLSSVQTMILTGATWETTTSNASGYVDDCTLVNLSQRPTTTSDSTIWGLIYTDSALASGVSCNNTSVSINVLTDVQSAQSSGVWFTGFRYDDMSASVGSLDVASPTLELTYTIPTVTGAPTNLSATGTSVDQIDLSWTAPDTSSSTIPAVSGYRIQSSDFAFANSSLPTGRSADADVYGAITGGVDMDTANLYLSMNTTQDVAGSGLVFNNDYTDASWVDNNLGGSYGDATVGTSSIDLDVTNTSTSNYPHNSRNFELDSALSNEWVMRYAFTINSKGTTLGNAYFNVMLIDDKWLGGGWDGQNENAGNGDFISAMYHVHTSDNKWGYATADNFSHGSTVSKTGISYGVGETHYFELRRTSATAISVDYHGQGGFGTATDTATASIASSIANLDTIAIGMPYQNGMGTWNISVKDIQVCDGTSTWSDTCVAEGVILDESYRGNNATPNGSAKATFDDSFTSDNWTDTDDKIEVNTSDGRLDFDARRDSSDDKTVYDLQTDLGSGTNASETAWVLRYDLVWSTIGSGDTNYIFVGLSDSAVAHNSNADRITTQYRAKDSTHNTVYASDSDGGSLGGSTGDANSQLNYSTGTTYYVTMTKTSGTAYTVSIKTGSHSGTEVVSLSGTVASTVDNLRYIVVQNLVSTGSATAQGYIDNMEFYNGVSSVDDAPKIVLSLDSSLNMEGTNSAVFDGSNDYMTLPSDNTIIPTSSAFMMGANIKPDKIISTTYSDDFSSDGWTDTGSGVSVTGGKLNWNNVAMGADNRASRAIGSTLSDTTWLMRFEFNTSAYNIPNQWIMFAVDNIGNPDSTSQDGIGVVLHDSNKFRLATKDSQTDYYDQSSNYGDLNHTVATNTNYYIEVARTSATTATMKVFSDSSFSTQVGSDVDVTIESTITGLDNLQTGVQSGGSSSRTMSANLDNLKIYNGITDVNDQTIFSYPTSAGSVDFNIEGANLVFRSGDKNNDPIISSAHGMSSGTKYNVAVSRDGSNNFEIFVQGDRVGSVVSNSTALGGKSSGELHYIGKNFLKSDNTATHTDSFTSDNWTDWGSNIGVDTGTDDRLEYQIFRTGTSSGSYYDFGSGAISDTSWVLRFKLETTAWDVGGGSHKMAFFGLSTNDNDSWSTSGDSIGFHHQISSSSSERDIHPVFNNNANYGGGQQSELSTALSTSQVHYYELKRDGSTYTISLSDGNDYNGDVESQSYTLTDGISGLRYFVITNDNTYSIGGSITGYIDDLEFYNGVTCASDCETSSNYYDGKMDEFYVMTGQSDDTISNISSRSENTWTDRSYNTGGTGTTYSHTSISGGGGTEVAYRVSAHNSVGLSSEYDLVLGQTANTPSAPQNLSIASTSPTVLTLDWDAPASQGASSISAYKVYRGTSSGFTLNSGSLVTTITDTSVTEYANSGLTSDTRYYYSVLATNAQGDGTQADANAYTLLNAPTSLTATGVSTSQINLAWTAPSGANNLDGYKIEYNNGSWQTLVADTGSTGTTYSHTSLSTGNSFTYRVSGLFGSLAGLSSATAQGSTYAVPSAITDLSGVGLTGSSLRISWTAPSSTPALTGYMIEISEDNFSTSTTLESNTGDTDTSYDATGLSENVDYYFRVKAINSIGTATTSNIPTVQTGASQSGGGGGGGGSPSFVPQFDELISLSVFGNAHKLTLGESIQDTLRLEWNSAEDLQVNEVIVGDNPFRFAVQKPPFIVLGDADGLSNAEISYTIQVPNNYCTMDITVQCVEPDFYEVPVNVKVLSEGRTITKNVVITVDLTSGFDPALFVILLVAGIASLGIYRISRGSSGKKKNGSVRKTVNSKPKGRKNGSVKKALSL